MIGKQEGIIADMKEGVTKSMTEGIFLEPLGLYLLVERRRGRIGRIGFSTERPKVPMPPEEKEFLLKCWLEAGEVPWELLDLSDLTDFQRVVLSFVATIPLGETLTYGQVAERLGKAGAARAVGQALKANPFPLIIPCHRVVGSKGLGGYSSGPDLKRRILDVEKEICHLNLL
ncbi:MAG TPA: MGMT family protein [Methanothrix sp.]|nr:MGMT family protein [Methanothrix sp.]HPJ84173.1 MGMT family protein [Methanothrix sp.]HPR66225.1 MGMT family protein [Methanothrix sp.]